MRGKKIWVIILIIIIIADGGYFSSEYIKKKNELNNYMGEITTYIADKEYDKAKETLEKAKALDLSNDELIRDNGDWKYKAVGELIDGSIRDLRDRFR